MLSPITLLPVLEEKSVIYKYKCHSHNWYVGRTSQRLRDCIKQYVLKWLIQYHTSSQQPQPNCKCKKKQTTPECNSAIGQHFLESSQCAANYQKHLFSFLVTAHSLFHLSLLLPTLKYITPTFAHKKSSLILLTCLSLND